MYHLQASLPKYFIVICFFVYFIAICLRLNSAREHPVFFSAFAVCACYISGVLNRRISKNVWCQLRRAGLSFPAFHAPRGCSASRSHFWGPTHSRRKGTRQKIERKIKERKQSARKLNWVRQSKRIPKDEKNIFQKLSITRRWFRNNPHRVSSQLQTHPLYKKIEKKKLN